jgi:Ala-tRNA(Pro) deacylase
MTALSHIKVRLGCLVQSDFQLREEATMGIAITLAQYLLDSDVPYELVPHPHTESALGSARASRLPPERVVKAVVVKGTDGFMLALVPASRHIQFDKLRLLLGDEVNIAGEEQVETLFVDCEPGSVPALGAAYGLDVIVDDSLKDQSDVYVEGGDHANLVHLSGASFQKLMKDARHGQFTDARSV